MDGVCGYVDHYNDVHLNSATGYNHAEGDVGGAAAGDPRGARPEVAARKERQVRRQQAA
jgi:hypothetical protein